MIEPSTIAPGDRIKFKAATRLGFRAAWRTVRGFDNWGRPLVGYAGWSDFIVRPSEILEVAPKAEEA